jgi:signal transduction histidine kinase
MVDLASVRAVPLFSELSDEQLNWIIEHSTEICLAADTQLFKDGAPANNFYVLLDGTLEITKQVDGVASVLATHQAGAYSAEVPILSGSPYIADSKALVDSVVMAISAENFRQMLKVCPQVATIMLPNMGQRVEGLQKLTQQHEKMAALGKLSAGLAHELNNPAAAATRAATQMRQAFTNLLASTLELTSQVGLSGHELEHLITLRNDLAQKAATPVHLDPLDQSDREDELNTWLDDHEVQDGWELAPALVEAGVDTEWLDNLATQLDTATELSKPLNWLVGTLQFASLLNTVEQGTFRISELVKAVKTYSYMDQAPIQDIDVREGLESTLTILGHKLRSINVTREYATNLPRINGFGTELNQIWTNLLDNAADALKGTPNARVWVRTRTEQNWVVVEIADNGPGVPPEIQTRVFEPFFTTKPVGEGTGLGLDTTYRTISKHKGDIKLISQPGDTRFIVRLPISTK